MKHRHLRVRLAAVGAAPTLALAGVAALPSPAHAADPLPAPAAAGADWLTGQLTGGLIHNDQYGFDDYGLSVDTGLALHALGRDTAVTTISDALAPHVADYYSYYVTDADTHVSAGSLAKALVFAQIAGADPTSYGGHDLVSELDARVSTDPASLGRIGDQFFPDQPYEEDFANTVGQAFAANGLTAATDPQAAVVTNFLLQQQCSAGYFRLDLGADLTHTCDADAGTDAAEPSVDTTALAVLELQGNPAATAAVQRAVTWLQGQQAADGSFTDGTEKGAANANSTGLAGWALGVQGDSADAAKAAVYLRGLQAADPSACRTELTPNNGAIAFDADAKGQARAQGITDDTQDQFRRASSQAIPALAYLPAASGTPKLTLLHRGFLPFGSTAAVSLSGASAGSTVCFAGGGVTHPVTVDAQGRARGDAGRVTSPGSLHVRAITVDGTLATATYRVLNKKTLPVTVKKHVKRGGQQRVKVSGLRQGESLRVYYRGHQVAQATANAVGKVTERFAVGNHVGTQKVRVRGQFADRVATTHFQVVRGT